MIPPPGGAKLGKNKPFKRPESVLVVVYTAEREVLVLRRRNPADFRQSVTGSLKRGESYRAAAARELREETGLLVSSGILTDLHHSVLFPIKPAWRSRYAPSVHFNREHWFAFRLPSRRLVRLSTKEHSQARWLRADAAARRVTSWTNREAIELLQRRGLV